MRKWIKGGLQWLSDWALHPVKIKRAIDMHWKYTLGSIIIIPLLPMLYWQGKRIRRQVPKLPEAKGPEGMAGNGYSKTLNLLVIGESTIAGVGVKTHEEGFTGTLARELSQRLQSKIKWNVYAKSGYTAQTIRSKLLPKISGKRPDLMVLGLGGNDAFTLNSPKKWGMQVNDLIQDLQSKFPDTPIFFTNMPPIKEFPAFTPLIKFSIGNLVEILGKELQKRVLNFEEVFYQGEVITIKEWSKRYPEQVKGGGFFSDGIHPSKLTYQVWAKDMAGYIVDQVALRDSGSQIRSNRPL